MINKTVIVAAFALVVAGCKPASQSPAAKVPTTISSPTLSPTSKPTEPTGVKQSRPVASSTPKAVVATPTPKVSERIYIPVYQNPTPKKITASPVSQPKQVENKPTPVSNELTIPAQSGSCKELSARGINNIDVKANPWAKQLDRDNDGVACESNQ